MANQLILEGNYDSTIHTLKHNCDAFGNTVEPPVGFRMLLRDEEIRKTDWHFDIYGGWVQGHGERNNGSYVHCEGRWRGWARKI